jgi:hypothetical protein
MLTSWTVTTRTGSLAISESALPQTISVTIHDRGDNLTTTIDLPRKEWEQLMEIAGRYSTRFTWAPEAIPAPEDE